MKSNVKHNNTEAPTLKGLQNYTIIKELGRGATGSVSLVKCLSGDNKDKLYALKQVSLLALNPKEAKMAENEVQLLKVLVGPTIIRYYDSFSTKESISIIMEYAEGGNLSDRIKAISDQGKKFSRDIILNWTSQIALGLMTMHIKKILHRDIKTQNMFLVNAEDEEVVKIGDFGISKELGTTSDMAKTSCGTPYFMSPEVVRGELYNDKSDMWALGCVLYELSTFRKPFDSNTVAGLYEQIKLKEFAPLPNDTEPVIRMLINTLLNKDPNKRPSVWEFSKLPEINKRIHKFVERHDYNDMVAHVLQAETKTTKQASAKQVEEETKAFTHSSALSYVQLDETVHLLRSNIKLQNIKVGWFKTHENCVPGSELVSAIQRLFGVDTRNAIESLERFIDKGVLFNVDGSTKLVNSDKALYRFQMDREDIAANMVWPWMQEYRKPLLVSAELLTKIINIYKDLLKESDEGKLYIEYEKLAENADYTRFVSSTAELQGVNLSSLDKKEKSMFFLNIYQSMYLHFLFKYSPQKTSSGIISKLWDNNKAPNFYYNIAGMDFSLNEIKHGVLRGNKKVPGAVFRTFSSGDKRKLLPDVLLFLYS
jgi:NIMA (never in mitosis gene a)-related kinase